LAIFESVNKLGFISSGVQGWLFGIRFKIKSIVPEADMLPKNKLLVLIQLLFNKSSVRLV